MKKLLHDTFNPHNQWISPVVINLQNHELFHLFYEWGLRKGAEIGASENSEVMCEAGLELTCVDPWSSEEEFIKALNRLKPYNVKFLRTTSMEAARRVDKVSLDFVYIDGNRKFDFVMEDIITWARRVRPGGIVAGHDYVIRSDSSAVEAVHAYTAAHNIQEWYVTRNEPGAIGTNFFWAKE